MFAAIVLGILLASIMPPPLEAGGKAAYETRCATCHGDDLRGSANAPPLRGAGAAALDFWMVTGRMPAAVPRIQIGHRGQQLALIEIRAIEAYVAAVDPSGPPIPPITRAGDMSTGRALFQQDCQHCHGVDGNGAALGQQIWAPTLHLAQLTQVAEAIRTGPGNMPRFGAAQLDDRALQSVATYVMALDTDAVKPRIPLSSSGPVPEGLFGWLTIGVLSSLAYLFSRPPAPPRTP